VGLLKRFLKKKVKQQKLIYNNFKYE